MPRQIRIEYPGAIYDALGNRAGNNFVANHGSMTFTRKDNGLNQYQAWLPFSNTNYDDDVAGWGNPAHANGVLMQEGNITAGYNALNQMVMVNCAATGSNWMFFGYDPLGRCVKRWTGPLNFNLPFPWVLPDSNPATYLYYDGWSLIQEGPDAATMDRVYMLGNRVDEIVADYGVAQGHWLYHHSDVRGHAILLTDSSGALVEQYEYDAFGQPYFFNASGTEASSSAYGNRFLFTGREYLSDLKLYDYRNRMYQPELGRFMQPDSKEFGAGDYNLYRYCHNDPVNKTDPTGLDDLNLFQVDGTGYQGDQDRLAAKYTDKAPISDRAITVGAHGNSSYMLDSHRQELPATKLAQMIKEVKNSNGETKYKPGMPVILNSCATGDKPRDGSDSAAQKLANALGKGSIVKAPTSDVTRHPDGSTTINHREGEYQTFKWKKDP